MIHLSLKKLLSNTSRTQTKSVTAERVTDSELRLQFLLPRCPTFLQVMGRSTKRVIRDRYLCSQVSLTGAQLSSYFFKFAQCDADDFVRQQSQWTLEKPKCLHGLCICSVMGMNGGFLYSLQWPLVVTETLLMSSSCRPIAEMA